MIHSLRIATHLYIATPVAIFTAFILHTSSCVCVILASCHQVCLFIDKFRLQKPLRLEVRMIFHTKIVCKLAVYNHWPWTGLDYWTLPRIESSAL